MNKKRKKSLEKERKSEMEGFSSQNSEQVKELLHRQDILEKSHKQQIIIESRRRQQLKKQLKVNIIIAETFLLKLWNRTLYPEESGLLLKFS